MRGPLLIEGFDIFISPEALKKLLGSALDFQSQNPEKRKWKMFSMLLCGSLTIIISSTIACY